MCPSFLTISKLNAGKHLYLESIASENKKNDSLKNKNRPCVNDHKWYLPKV
jgi:hypothetical protein